MEGASSETEHLATPLFGGPRATDRDSGGTTCLTLLV